ncbi:phage tail assembly chaperone [Burkholderia thailandensis]|uniref:phage tail assembly chaperone n=1 Tax=Burkholderia thailandensis TaxID=57975 RepID=UPI00031F92C6|nr:phage tail assembly chaperone [Burkholderia thailandensis]MCS3393196.1 phage tail assembly chaperone [Burkholderia thailandensis]MCS6426230.1 phage tail assembly chaperone [Burkholderia thailandensis]MCS6455503.1 phage tail assembly chaperone [Burkholderia thailandensis]MCS6465446.1 phage tail assembly chaperone [Burkholderia thailandensis]MCS6484079.1 phage tail assembly chaperone [Burkholderia thailandensis]
MEHQYQVVTNLRAAVLNPLAGWRHELMSVPEWNNEKIAVREPTVGDRMFWIEALRDIAGVTEDDDETAVREKFTRASDDAHMQANARLFVRVVFGETPDGWRRLFSDDDATAVAEAFGPVHNRIVVKALEFGKLDVDPVEDAKKPSAEPQASAS